MGTRGFRIIKFRGRYWIFYNHWDSYPSGLGKSLVDGIPPDPEGYRKWLQSQRDFFAKWDSLLQRFLTIQPEDMRKLHSDEPHMPSFHAAFDERLQEDAPPYYVLEFNDFVDWTYTIDLDREVFSVDSGAHFRLNYIPPNDKWIEALFMDNKVNRFLLPHLVPAESIATLSLGPPSFTTSTKYETLQTRLVKPKALDDIPPSYLTGPRLRWMLFNFFQVSQQRDLSANLLGWQAQDLPFRELAFFILSLASGGEHLALVDQRRVKKPYDEGLYLGIMTDNESEGDAELATSLGVGYHMDGLPMGSAPKETKYWFEGALICLAPQLNHPGILEKAVADATEYGRANRAGTSFNAVLISIEHLVLIKSLSDGSVDHTELLPLIPITTHLSQDPRARYGDQALDAFYDAKFTKNDQEEGEPDETNVEQLSQHSGQQDRRSDDIKDAKSDGQDREEEIEEEETKDDSAEAKVEDEQWGRDSEKTEEDEEDVEMSDGGGGDEAEPVRTALVTGSAIKNSFMALIQFFEATTREALRPTSPNEARLPEEICEMVLRNVSDIKTFNSCLKVSRRFRLFCQQRSLLIDNIVILEPLPNDSASLDTKEKDESTRDQMPPPDFLAVEVSSDRQMEVWLRSGGRGDGYGLTCFVVAGSEWNRKTYVANHGVQFQGLCVPAPRVNEAGKVEERAEWCQDKGPSLRDSERTPWEGAMKCYRVDTESETQILGEFWKDATRALKRELVAPSQAAWTLPPNTLCFFGTQVSFPKGTARDRKSFHYLYLRVKRASKYWDNLWDDIIREATEHLDCTDDRKIRFDECPEGEVIGADDPYVILAVGVEVRLFQWEQGFDDSVSEGARRKKSPSSILKEVNPGMTLRICEKSDREEFEKFLEKAEQHKEMVKARVSE